MDKSGIGGAFDMVVKQVVEDVIREKVMDVLI